MTYNPTMVDSINMYEQSKSTARQPAVEDYAPLVKRIAQHMMVRMPASVQLDDLIQAGMIGLIEASVKYDASQGASFETYAGIRIRGSIIDEMRRGDWVPRSVHRNSRRINQAMMEVENREGRDATNQEIADALDVPLDDYHVMSQDAMSGRLFSIEESFTEEEPYSQDTAELSPAFTAPHLQVQKDNLRRSIAENIKNLPEREQLVLSLYYDEELNLKEIGQILGVSESRVSQIHSQAALKLRSRLQHWC
jgi:RNA polymerase sigma factor for flagellar operon FliA